MNKALIAKLQLRLKAFKRDLAKKDKEMLKDDEVQDDTKWVNDYHNLNGHIEELESIIGMTKP